MPQAPNWVGEVFSNALDGVSSAVSPELISPSQLSWGQNIANRGGKPATRPSFNYLMTLPSGLVQGVSYFSVQGGMGVVSIGGEIFRLRLNSNTPVWEQIALPWRNSANISQVYMQQTVESLVIQDGQSDAIIYDGSTAVRSDPSNNGVPRGKQMAYGNGRLWVAINNKQLVAGDIRQETKGSELQFTENNYLSGGGSLYFPRGITGLAFIPTTGTSDYGALVLFGVDYADTVRADITSRDLWSEYPGFVTSLFRHTGCASHWSIVQVNQDLYWRDKIGGIRSLRASLADESGPGSAPISREVSRLTDYDSQQLMEYCSGIAFDNRLLMTSSPYLNLVQGVNWGSLIPLDFAPISTMRGKSLPAYDGQWTGINFTHLFQGDFNGQSRAFAISHDDSGTNSLWEINQEGRGGTADYSVQCTSGSSIEMASPIVAQIEHGRRVFGDPTKRKKLERCDVYISDVEGNVDLQVFWRCDNNQKWQLWNETTVCAKMTDPPKAGTGAHVWKNLLPQQRPQIKTFTIPDSLDQITGYYANNGFEFQIRLVWTGKMRVYKTVLSCRFMDDSPYAEILDPSCLYNDITDTTGNSLTYKIPVIPCPFLTLTDPVDQTVSTGAPPVVFEQFSGPFNYPPNAFGGFYSTATAEGENRVRIADNGNDPWTVSCCFGGECTVDDYLGQGASRHVFSGRVDVGIDGSITGGLTDDLYGRGAWPSTFIYPAPAHIPLKSTTISGLFNLIGNTGGPFLSQHSTSYIDYNTGNSIQRYYTDASYQGVHGYFGGYAGLIWCLGYDAKFTYSNMFTMADLGKAISVTGDPAKIQHLVSGGSSAYDGTTSRANVTISAPAGISKAYVELQYTVTPDDGSAAYNIVTNIEVPVASTIPFHQYIEFPKIADAIVTANAAYVYYYKSIGDDFEEMTNPFLELYSVEPSSNWSGLGVLANTSPNSETWDNFEKETASITQTDPSGDNVNTFLYQLANGQGWSGMGILTGLSPTEAADDFEMYTDYFATGIFFGALYGGYGWNGYGHAIVRDFQGADDDFELVEHVGLYVPPTNTTVFKQDTNSVVSIPDNAAYHLGNFTLNLRYQIANAATPNYYNRCLFSNITPTSDGIGIYLYGKTYAATGPNTSNATILIRLKVGGVESRWAFRSPEEFSNDTLWVPGAFETFGLSVVRSGSFLAVYNGLDSGPSQASVDGYSGGGSYNTGLSGTIGTCGPMLIGQDPYYVDPNVGAIPPFSGTLAEVRLWNYARTKVQLQTEWNNLLFGNESGLVAYFRLDEAGGTTAYDISVTANNGTRGSALTVQASSVLYLPNYYTSAIPSFIPQAPEWVVTGNNYLLDSFYADYSGYFTLTNGPHAFDNFEAEAAGTITSLTHGSGWSDVGTFTTTT